MVSGGSVLRELSMAVALTVFDTSLLWSDEDMFHPVLVQPVLENICQ